MRVVIVCNEFPPCPHGGIGSAAFDLAVELVKQGVQVEVIGIYQRSQLVMHDLAVKEQQHGLTVTRLPSHGERLPFRLRVQAERLQLLLGIRNLHRRQSIDIVFSEDFEGLLPWGVPKGVHTVIRLNGSNLVYDALLERSGSPSLWNAERKTLVKAGVWLSVSEYFLSETSRRIPPHANQRLDVIPNPVDTELFSPSESRDTTVPGRIVFHNSLHPRKGLPDLFDALPAIVAAVPEAHLEIYGAGSSGTQNREALTERIPKSLHGKVTFFGRTDRTKLPDVLEKAHVACYPSRLETFGIAPVEAMAMERVTVYGDCGPAHEVIEHGVDGFISPTNDPTALGETLIKALRLPLEQRIAIGKAARKKAVEHFSRERVTARYLKIFRSIIT